MNKERKIHLKNTRHDQFVNQQRGCSSMTQVIVLLHSFITFNVWYELAFMGNKEPTVPINIHLVFVYFAVSWGSCIMGHVCVPLGKPHDSDLTLMSRENIMEGKRREGTVHLGTLPHFSTLMKAFCPND